MAKLDENCCPVCLRSSQDVNETSACASFVNDMRMSQKSCGRKWRADFWGKFVGEMMRTSKFSKLPHFQNVDSFWPIFLILTAGNSLPKRRIISEDQTIYLLVYSPSPDSFTSTTRVNLSAMKSRDKHTWIQCSGKNKTLTCLTRNTRVKIYIVLGVDRGSKQFNFSLFHPIIIKQREYCWCRPGGPSTDHECWANGERLREKTNVQGCTGVHVMNIVSREIKDLDFGTHLGGKQYSHHFSGSVV